MTRNHSRVVFVVGNSIQQENALEVAKHISEVAVSYLNLWTGKVHYDAFSFEGHSPNISLFRIAKLVFRSPISAWDVTVIPQDVGLLQRILARSAKRAGSLVALMPDGVVAAGPNENGSKARLILRGLVDSIMNSVRLVEGRAGSMGSSDPHLLLSWGAGWNAAFAAARTSEVRHVGCPRMDQYSRIPSPEEATNLLICSQPLGIPSWSRPHMAEWYAFLESLLDGAIPNCSVRVRLHPAERNDRSVPERLRSMHLNQSLATDLEWASQVASPFSTVLVEALAAGRPFFALSRDDAFELHANRSPFFADDRIQVARWNPKDIQNTLSRLTVSTELKKDYLCHAGRSAELTGQLLETVAIKQRIGG